MNILSEPHIPEILPENYMEFNMSIESLSISKPFFELKFVQDENSYVIKSPSILINLSNVKISIKDQLLSKISFSHC